MTSSLRRGGDAPATIARNRQRGRLNTALVLRSLQSRRLEGRSRLRWRVRWSVLRDASPAAPLLRTRPPVGGLAATIARKFCCKPLKRWNPRPTFGAISEEPLSSTQRPLARLAGCSRRAVGVRRQPCLAATIARKFCCKPLKRWNPRPTFAGRSQAPQSRTQGPLARLAGSSRRAVGVRRQPCFAATIARKFCCKPLKRWNPRPTFAGRSQAPQSRTQGPPARLAGSSRRAVSVWRHSCLAATIARKFCCKPLKRWNLRPTFAGRSQAPRTRTQHPLGRLGAGSSQGATRLSVL